MNDITQLTTQAQPSKTAVVKQPGEQPAVRQTRLAPPVDIFENHQSIMLLTDLSGVPRERLGVHVQDGTLTVDAELMVFAPQGLRLQHGEARHPHLSRTFTPSPDFDASRTDAQLRDRILKLTIPRRGETKPRRIEVQAS